MPAWGTTHDDEAIWGLVAFLQKLPDLSADEYASMTAQEGAHAHGGHDRSSDAARGATEGEHVDPLGSQPHGHGTEPPTKSKQSNGMNTESAGDSP